MTRGEGTRLPSAIDAYVRVAGLVDTGEWTTYGDISTVVHGSSRAARAVGRAAASISRFPNAERVIGSGGRIPSGWRDDAGRGPEECQRRLEAQGVRFEDARADPARHVGWEVLAGRAREAGIAGIAAGDVP